MAQATPQSKARPQQTTAESVRETLESIVVAFILAFVFRAFIVEAFVIPTGSMATTLYGAQMTHTCSICGYHYAMGVPFNADGVPVAKAGYFQCPNCNTATDEVSRALVRRYNSGDRILVHKWPFHTPGESLGPRRWDVTVFKDPSDGQTNYIKRLVGMPGEVLEIIDGDVYTVPLEKLDPGVVGELIQLRDRTYAYQRTREPAEKRAIQDRLAELNRKIVPLMSIQRKTERAQKSLWFNVYDHDYLPNYGALKTTQRVGWRPIGQVADQAWNASRREVTFANDSEQWLALQFAGKPIDDFYAYNADGQRRSEDQRYPVGDVRLRFIWFPEVAQGGLQIRLTKHRDEFLVAIMCDGTVGIPDIGTAKLPPFVPGQAVPIEFSNVDYRVTLKINNEIVIDSGSENGDKYAPSTEHLLQVIDATLRDRKPGILPTEVQIAARRTRCRLRHLVLERDVYYLSRPQEEPGDKDPNREKATNRYLEWRGWGTEGMPILLLDDSGRYTGGRRVEAEYFMCGDNSPESKDSRLWWKVGEHLEPRGKDYQLGTVPRDQVIGKAFFVYWPSGYRQDWAGGAGIVPNFGKMRWIR
jgi:signal peptidase I